MRNLRLFLAVCFCTLALSGSGFAQATGIYAFGPYDSPGFDTINRGNLNIHFSIPVFSKPGRGGSNFSYALTYDGLVWLPKSSSGASVWTPAPAWGWGDATNAEWGYVTYDYSLDSCTLPPHGIKEFYAVYSSYVYHDNKGNAHPIPYGGVTDSCGNTAGPTGTGTYTLTDNSGLVLYRNSNSFVVFTKQGAEFSVPSYVDFNGYQEQITPGVGTSTDTNGNEISASSSGVFTDTMGKTALKVSGSAPNPVVYTYTDSNGNSQTVTVNYTEYTVQTDFGVSGITEFSQASTPLVSSIVYSADSTSYSFTYETTPNNSSAVTGRITKVTLRTGGNISYTYTGGNHGIESDGTISGLTRTTSDGSTSYVRSGISSTASTTTFTDATGNQTVSTFLINPTGGYFYESDRKAYAGTASGTPLLETATCYNSGTCSVTSAFSSISIATYQNGTIVNSDNQTYAGPELLQQDQQTATSTTTSFNYNEYSGPESIPFYRLASVTAATTTGSHTFQKATYDYDETTPTPTSGLPQHVAVSTTRGNLTSVHQWYTSGSTLNTTVIYDDAGQSLSQTDTNGDVTNYTYDAGTDTLLTQVTLPSVNGSRFSGSFSFDPNTGLLLSSTDLNGQTTSYSYDGMLRPTHTLYPDGGSTTITYSPNQIGLYRYMSSSTYENTQTLYDGYGRTSRVAVANGQGSNPYYQTDTCYNSDGLVGFASYSYQGNGWSTPQVCSSAGDTYSYDALGRALTVTHGDNTHVTYSYNGTATEVTDENGSSRIINMLNPQTVAGVCEISSSTLQGVSPANCNMPISGTGFLTTYAYNLASNEVTVTQGAQTRVFQTDWAGRPILVQEPESGQTSYSYAYNSTGLVVTRTKPQANQTSASVTTSTTTQYDSLGRPISISYSDGTPTKSFLYDNEIGWGTQTNIKGRMAGYITYTVPSNAPTTDYSYDPMGRVIATGSCSPAECGKGGKNLSYTYDWAGDLTSETSDINGYITYGRSPAGEVTSITNNTFPGTEYPANLLSNMANGPDGPTGYQLGNGLSVVLSYNGLGSLSGRWVCQNSSEAGCTGGKQLYGFIVNQVGDHVTGTCDTVLNTCINFGYDDFGRLASQNVNSGYSGQNFTYTYDRYGNRWAQNALNGGPSPSVSFNAATNQINSSGYAYDAAGNLTSDGIHTYTYDAEGNVIAVDGGSTAKYTYDSLSHRVESQIDGTTTDYVYDYQGRLIENEVEPADSADEGRIYWDGMLLAYRGQDANTYFEHPDWLGTTRLRTDYLGNVAATFTSLPFGDGTTPTINETDGAQEYTHFAMLDLDNESDTDHAQFRQYGNIQGRWMSPDPYSGSYDPTNPQSMNRYSYALNNPLSFVDPLGADVMVCDSDGDCTTMSDSDWQNAVNGPGNDGITVNADGSISCGGSICGSWAQFDGSLGVALFAPVSSAASARSNCTGSGVSIGVGGNADLGLVEGGSAQGSIMAGTTTTSTGETLSGGAMVGGPLGTIGAPTQITNSAVLGGYLGAGVQVGFTNAGSMQALSGPFKTLSFNIGLGQANFGASLSWSGNIFELNVTIPGLSEGAGVAASYMTTTTKVKTVNAVHSGPC
ncbi:MAG: RHS repeat-associated core domain-containing protein [Silvibacterium sp.]